jgi:UDP-N-acetylglucosamine 3-dehydrogenase
MKPVKIAILSLTHGHTRKYYQTLNDNPKLIWLAVYAETEKVRDNFLAWGYDIPCYMDEKEMLEKHPDIEAVVMASANNKHIGQFRECAKRGIHILSMKVPTFDMEEYTEIVELVEKAGIVCQIELELHYNPVVARMKDLVAKNALGKIAAINATNITLSPVWAFPWQGVPEESYGKRVQLSQGDNRFRGGALCDHPHVFDMIRWLTNSDFDYVYAEVGPNIRPDIVVEDTLLINGKMKNGVSFLFDTSWSRLEERLEVPAPGWEIYPKRMEVNVTISGEKGVVLVDCFGPNVYHNGIPNDRYTVQYTYFDEWIGLMDEFVDCIRNKNTPKINLIWHRKTIETINACYDSIESGEIIYL